MRPNSVFRNKPILVKRMIPLLITWGNDDHAMTKRHDFLVVDLPSEHSAIFGRPPMKKLKLVSVVYYLTVKFPTPNGTGFIMSNKGTWRRCHILSIEISQAAVRDATVIKEEIPLEDLNPWEHTLNPEPMEKTVNVHVGNLPEQVIKRGNGQGRN